MTAHKWQFTSRFRHHAFGWRSDTPIQRIKEALSEIKQIAKKDPELAAEGAVRFLEKISPALEQVDSSSGAIGSTVNRAIETLVPIIIKANVTQPIREQWLERLFEAIQNDHMPYIESLGDYWGELCVDPQTASRWADEFLPSVRSVWSPQSAGRGFFSGTVACLSSLLAAGRHQELLELLDQAPFRWWAYRQWGVKSLVAMGKISEAIQYAEGDNGINAPHSEIAAVCEEILLSSGLTEEAYKRYAIDANQCTTNLATFRAMAKKYPDKSAEVILRDLVARYPGDEGKWFAAAKDAGLFELAIELISHSPADPRTLIRATRDFAEDRPDFAISVGLTALHWMSRGYGYQITATDVLDVYSALVKASSHSEITVDQIKAKINDMLASQPTGNDFIMTALKRQFASD